MEVEIKENSARIIPDEKIDRINAEEMREKILEMVEKEKINNIILDFQNVKKINSYGLGKLLLLKKITKENELNLKIDNVNSEEVRKVFGMIDLGETINIDM